MQGRDIEEYADGLPFPNHSFDGCRAHGGLTGGDLGENACLMD